MSTTTYQTPAEAAADIRRELKAKGISSRQVSVRAKSFSMGSSIDIEIHDPAVSIKTVHAAADAKEKIDRDMWGEILSGGNRYLHVSYSNRAVDAFLAANAEACAALLRDLPPQHSNVGGPEVQLDGKRLVVFREHNGVSLMVRNVDDCSQRPAGLAYEPYLTGPNGPRNVAEAVLSMRDA